MDSGFSGRLSVMPLVDLLRNLLSDGQTGVLKFGTPVAPASVWVVNGVPVDAVMGRRTGSSVLDLLTLFDDAGFNFTPGLVERANTIAEPGELCIEHSERLADESAALVSQLPPLVDPIELDEEALALVIDRTDGVQVEAARFLRQGCSLLELLVETQFPPAEVLNPLASWASVGALCSALPKGAVASPAGPSSPAGDASGTSAAIDGAAGSSSAEPATGTTGTSQDSESTRSDTAAAGAQTRVSSRPSHTSVRPRWARPSNRVPGAAGIKVPLPSALVANSAVGQAHTALRHSSALGNEASARGPSAVATQVTPGYGTSSGRTLLHFPAPEYTPTDAAPPVVGSRAIADAPIVPQRIVSMRPSAPPAAAPSDPMHGSSSNFGRRSQPPSDRAVPPSGEYPRVTPLHAASSRPPPGVSIMPPPVTVRATPVPAAAALNSNRHVNSASSSSPGAQHSVARRDSARAHAASLDDDAWIADLRKPQRKSKLLVLVIAVVALGAVLALLAPWQ